MLVESAEELQWKIYEERVRWGLDGCPREKKSLVLSVDIVFFKGIAFLITVSRDMRLITEKMLQDRML
jgi:hypothetical protein